MDREYVVAELERVLEMSPGSLRDEDEMRSLEHWDSLKLLEVLVLADQQFHIEMDADRLAGCTRIGDVVRLIEDSPAVRDLKPQVRS